MSGRAADSEERRRVGTLSTTLALLALLWIAVTCVHAPAQDTGALAADGALRAACERALASLAPEEEPARRVTVALPEQAGPAVRALGATGRGDGVVALEAALERTARLALADAGPWLAESAARPVSEDASADGSTVAAFRAAHEAELRARLAEAAPARLGETGALDALARLRDEAGRLPLPRSLELDPVSLVTEQALDTFFDALGDEERHLREERRALGGG
jgi:hypothetical protein